MPVLKINHVLLVPWIVLSLPSAALFQLQLFIIPVLAIAGLAGMLTGNPTVASSASSSLLALIIWGKIAGDLYGLAGLDSALLLLQFMLVILLMEASKTVLTLDNTYRRLQGGNDDLSVRARVRATEWARAQLLSLGKLITAAFGLSLGLLVVGDLVSVSVNQLAFSAILVLAAVMALLILLTYRREPEESGRPPR
jgi:hypothetical protein